MANWTKDKLTKGNLSITGSSSVMGGSFEKVRIVGEGTVEGDVTCESMRCIGTLDMNGSLKSDRLKVVGTCSFSGSVQAEIMKISGTVTIGGSAKLMELRCSGTIEAHGDLHIEALQLRGQLNTQGNCQAEVFNASGIFNIGGHLNAGKMDIRLYQNCQADEIGGEQIKVRKASVLNPFNLFFKPASHAMLIAAIIEGDDIYLENTRAKVVRGNKVTIGCGCEIERVEYQKSLDVHKNAAVKEQLRL